MATRGSSQNSHLAAGLVRTARTRRGMSQRALARSAGVPQSTVANIESGRQQPSMTMLDRLLDAAGFRLDARLVNATRPSLLLEEHRSRVAEVLARYPVSRVWVFGSVARGDDGPDSDVDLCVELTADASFVQVVDLEEDLAGVLGCRVDVVTTQEVASNELFRRRVYRDRRPLPIAVVSDLRKYVSDHL
ncbi:MAG: helix-turn-helix domain-containing protein [Actinomycetota bacterium]